MESNMTDLSLFKLKKTLVDLGALREYEGRYEFCLLKDYEEKFEEFFIDSIQIEDIFLNILEQKKKMQIVSYEFSKEIFNLTDIASWIRTHIVKLLSYKDNEDLFVHSAKSIICAMKFKGQVIVLYEKGNNKIKIDVNELQEVTDYFIPRMQKVDTGKSKYLESIEKSLRIILNGEKIDFIPRIDVDLMRDVILSNGNVIVADYIDDYLGYIGFYKNSDPLIPVAWLHDKETTVYINIYDEGSGKKIIAECRYVYNSE